MQSTDQISGYHAHVYYDAQSKPAAAQLRKAIDGDFDIEMGRWHDEPVGPHPMGSYQVAFDTTQFATLVPWLALNRGELIVFVHPLTDDIIGEHTANAIWLGEQQPLNIAALERAIASRASAG
jgi:aromatic ring-cleaving dioxygenase